MKGGKNKQSALDISTFAVKQGNNFNGAPTDFSDILCYLATKSGKL